MKASALSVPLLGKIRKLLQILRRAKTPKARRNTLFSDADTLATLHDSRSLDQISLLIAEAQVHSKPAIRCTIRRTVNERGPQNPVGWRTIR
jgi:hypothetical protein